MSTNLHLEYQSVAQRWNDMVEQFPYEPALSFGDLTLTYRKLDNHINRIAYPLMRIFPEPGQPIGFMLGLGWQPVAAIFGILKAGHIFVPMDANTPPQRLKRIIDHAGIQIILVDQQTAALGVLPDHMDSLNLDTLPGIPDLPEWVLNDAAYLVYTSGSTGDPKGVLHNHANILRYATLDQQKFDIKPGMRGAHLFDYGFAAARTMTFDLLLHGGHLYLYDIRRSGYEGLANWISSHQLNIMQILPAVFREILNALDGSLTMPDLQFLILAGEVVRRSDVQVFRQKIGSPTVLVNRLISTESGPVAEYWVKPDTTLEESIVPVGYPHTDLHDISLVDGNDQPVSDGQPGTITIKGEYLFLGYWDKELRSVTPLPTDPADPRKRIYRTSDSAIRLPDGMLVFQGRQDGIIKLSGQRVKLTDIEEAIIAHPSIIAVAVIKPDEVIESLAAIYTTNSKVTIRELRSYLTDLVPANLIPAQFIEVPSLPVTATGKVDPRALVDIAHENRSNGASTPSQVVAPRNETEALLVNIWCEVLGRQSISIHDDFFDLGGSSIDAAQIMVRLNQRLGIQVPLALLSKHATLAALAAVIQDGQLLEESWSPLVHIKETGSQPPLFVITGLRGNVLQLTYLAFQLGLDQPVIGLQPRGLDGRSQPFERVEEVAAYYIEAVRSVQPIGPYYFAGYSYGGYVAFEIARQLVDQGHTMGGLIFLDPAYNPRQAHTDDNGNLRWISGRTLRHLRTFAFSPLELLRMSRWRRQPFLRKKRHQLARALQSLVQDFSPPPMNDIGDKLEMINRRALRHYDRRPYPGSALYISATHTAFGTRRRWDKRVEQWGKLIQGGLQTCYVEGSHADLVADPLLIDQVGQCMARYLQAAHRSD